MSAQREGSQDRDEGEDNSDERPAEERHDLGGGKRGGKGSTDASSKSKRKRSCPMYFGVKSYLHQFYEDHTFKDPSVYEDDHQFLQKPRRRRCLPIWWKVFLWVGVNLLIVGVLGILVGFLVPQRHVLISSSTDPNGDVHVDENAQNYNTTLDMCTLIGLIFFCVGGVALTLSLLFTSFLSHYCGDDSSWRGDEFDPIKVPLNKEDLADPGPTSPLQMGIPVSGKVKNVQPEKKSEQQMLTQTIPTE